MLHSVKKEMHQLQSVPLRTLVLTVYLLTYLFTYKEEQRLQ